MMGHVTPERLKRVEELYHSARQRENAEREAFLSEACVGDLELLREVSALLAQDSGGPMAQPVLGIAASLLGDVRPGARFGPYEIVGILGEGGMGAVYRARDTRLARAVAIKFAHLDFSSRFQREARAISALNHPHICTLHDLGPNYLVMELVEGETLARRLQTGRLPMRLVLSYGAQIADALAAAHAKGIVHRDMKPSNIMITKAGIKILDFGVAKFYGVEEGTDTLTDSQTLVGTPAYMAPEQLEGKECDARVDIFALGLLLYEMADGRKAFTGDSRAALIADIMRCDPDLSRLAPPQFAHIVQQCLARDPENRWQTARDVGLELDFQSRVNAAAHPSSAKPHRRRVVAALLALLLLAVAGLLVWKYSKVQSSPPSLMQLTSDPGSELSPSFSPDGNQVAFSWDSEKADNAHIYVKMVGETGALRLTTDPAPEEWPTWSPDGKRIAFQRLGPEPGIWSVSPLGGAEQKLANLRVWGQMSWSPDGKWLAVARRTITQGGAVGDGLLLVPADGGEPHRFSNPRAPAFDFHPSFSPNGSLLAYAGCTSPWSCDIFVQQLDADYSPRENPRRITQQGLFIDGLAWSRDGRSLVYSGSFSWGVMPRLWRVDSSGKQQPERFELAGFQALNPSIAAAGNRLAFARRALDMDIWRYQPGGIPTPFLKSSMPDYGAEFSPDGTRIAFSSGRSGDLVEIWTVDADGSRPLRLTSEVGRGQGTPRWSPDGRLIVFDSLNQNGLSLIYVIDANGGRPRRVSSGTSNDRLPSWSRDGKWIYFSSNQTGRDEIRRVPMGEGQAQQITQNGGYRGIESTDGRTLFYTKLGSPGLFAKLLDGGPERRVLDHIYAGFAPVEDGIYYVGERGPDRQYPIQFYEFSTGVSRLLTKIEGPLEAGLSVSPDRRTFLFSKSAASGADLMLIENFR
jgi:serine/threonine protein kinase